jgi:hypothetical protein
MGAVTMGGTPEDLTALLASELKKWREVVVDADIHIQ